MNQVIVRKLDEDTKRRLKRRAASHGVSMEEEIRMILQDAVLKDAGKSFGLGSEIAALFWDIEGQEEPIPELPDDPVRPVAFDE